MSLLPYPWDLVLSNELELEVARIGIFDAHTSIPRRTIKIAIGNLQIFVSESSAAVGSYVQLIPEATTAWLQVLSALNREQASSETQNPSALNGQ